jgi:hypothetical protein
LSSVELRAMVAAARAEEQQARQQLREHTAGPAGVPSLEQALEALLATTSVSSAQRPLLLQIREAADRLLAVGPRRRRSAVMSQGVSVEGARPDGPAASAA